MELAWWTAPTEQAEASLAVAVVQPLPASLHEEHPTDQLVVAHQVPQLSTVRRAPHTGRFLHR